MKDAIFAVIAIVCVVCGFILLDTGERRVIYDCSIAEISPDFPIKAREECRKMRRQKQTPSIST